MTDIANELTARQKAAAELHARLNAKVPFWTVVCGWNKRVAQVQKITPQRGARTTSAWPGSTQFEPLCRCIGVFATAEAAKSKLKEIQDFDIATDRQLSPLREDLKRQEDDRATQRLETFPSLDTE